MFGITAILMLYSAGMAYAQYDDTIVVMRTGHGTLVIELFPNDAPNHVANFVELVQDGFYDNTIFHRIIPGFMIQGGDPNTKPGSGVGQDQWGMGGPEYSLEAEFNNIMHDRGIVSMARANDPNSAGSQFFIVHQDSNFLDTSYTVFGRLATVESYDTLDAIAGTNVGDLDRPIQPDSVRIIFTEVLSRDQVSDLQDMGPPQRTTGAPQQPQQRSGDYTSKAYNFSIRFPEGWAVQDLGGMGRPNLAAVGPGDSAIPSNIAVYIEDAGNHTLNTVRDSKLVDLESLAEDVDFQITNHQLSTINDYTVFTLDAQDKFSAGTGIIDVGYREVTIVSSGKIYTFLFSSVLDNFESDVLLFTESLKTFEVLVRDTSTEETMQDIDTLDDTLSGGGCLIATAAFGSEMATPIQQLRELRDERLMQTGVGYGFMTGFNTIYYTFSPHIADYERENPLFRDLVRLFITPMIYTLSVLTFVDMNSDVEVVVYGTTVILLTLLVYMGPLVVVAMLIRRKKIMCRPSQKVT